MEYLLYFLSVSFEQIKVLVNMKVKGNTQRKDIFTMLLFEQIFWKHSFAQCLEMIYTHNQYMMQLSENR